MTAITDNELFIFYCVLGFIEVAVEFFFGSLLTAYEMHK